MNNILKRIAERTDTIESDRIILREINLDDSDDMFEYTSNSDVCRYLSWSPHTTKNQVVDFINSTLQEYNELSIRYTFGIEVKDTRKLIGVISIFDVSSTSKRVEVSYILNPRFQGKGYMKESLQILISFLFNHVDIRRVQARCSVDNKGSEKVMKSIGMKYEGTLLKYWNIKDEYKDVLVYARLNERYE